jgi:hypothetical protein
MKNKFISAELKKEITKRVLSSRHMFSLIARVEGLVYKTTVLVTGE